MPRFERMDPKEVAIGRGRPAVAERAPYIDALKAGEAGRIELQRGERQAIVKRRLQEASRECGIKIRSSWENPRTLVWQRTRSR